MALLPEGKIQISALGVLCAKYRQVNTTSTPYHQCRKAKEAASLKVKALQYSCLLIAYLPSRSRVLN